MNTSHRLFLSALIGLGLLQIDQPVQANGFSTSTVEDTTAPLITAAPQATNVRGQIRINWQTNEAADSRVRFGAQANALNQVAGDIDFTRTHAVVLGALEPDARYYYQVSSHDPMGNATSSAVLSFIAPPARTLQVQVSGAGSVSSLNLDCSSQCAQDYPSGSLLTLTALPADGLRFAGWTGDCSGNSTVCEVELGGDKHVQAQFAQDAAPGVLVVSGDLSFGQVTRGTYVSRTLTLSNSGHTAIVISSITHPSGFAIDWSSGTLEPDDTRELVVSFSPTLSQSYSGAIGIEGNQFGGITNVAVSGEGVDPQPGALIESGVRSYYSTILNREVDSGGLAFWIAEAMRLRELSVGVDEAFRVMAGQFFNSAEYLGRNTSDVQFVTDLYRTFFRREPDQGGMDFWSGQLAHGMPRDIVLFNFLFSVEFGDYTESQFGATSSRPEVNLIVDFYRGLLGRLPDSDGFDYWLARFRSAQCSGPEAVTAEVDAISRLFANLPEYGARGRNNAQYVADLYYAFLRRGGDLGGFNAWDNALRSGAMSREDVRWQFLLSPEFQGRVGQALNAGCLR